MVEWLPRQAAFRRTLSGRTAGATVTASAPSAAAATPIFTNPRDNRKTVPPPFPDAIDRSAGSIRMLIAAVR